MCFTQRTEKFKQRNDQIFKNIIPLSIVGRNWKKGDHLEVIAAIKGREQKELNQINGMRRSGASKNSVGSNKVS